MILFGAFLIIVDILAFILFLSMMPTDPISWLIVGAALGVVMAIGIIMVAEGSRKK